MTYEVTMSNIVTAVTATIIPRKQFANAADAVAHANATARPGWVAVSAALLPSATMTKVSIAEPSGSWISGYDAAALPVVISDRGDAGRPSSYREYANVAAALVEVPNLADISVKMKGINRAGAVAIRFEID